MARQPHVVEDHLTGVRCPDAHLLELLPGREPRRAGWDDEARLAPGPERGVDGRHHDVHVGDPAVGDPRLGAVQDPLVLGLVVDRPGAQRADVGTGVGLRHGERGQLDLVRGAEALRAPLGDLLGGAVGDDARQAERAAEDGEPQTGVAPGELLVGDGQEQAGGVEEALGHEVEGVQPDAGGLLDDGPGRLLALVPFVGGRAHDVLGEVVHPLLDLELVFAQLERELRHVPSFLAPNPGLAGPGSHVAPDRRHGVQDPTSSGRSPPPIP